LPDIFDEVEEDLRAERARSFGRRYAGLAAAAVVLIVLGTTAYVWWSQHQEEATQAIADRFIAAAQKADKADRPMGGLDRDQAKQAEDVFADIAAHGPAGYKVLAQLRLAALQWKLGQTKQAITTWQDVSDNSAAPKLLRDFATLTSAQNQVDTADPVLLHQTVAALTDAGNPWAAVAEEVITLIDLRQGKAREAGEVMRRLSTDPMAPQGIRQMVDALITTLPPEAAAPAKTAPTPPQKNSPAPKTPATHG